MTMTSRTFTRLAGASLIVTTSMVGCSGAKMEQRPALASNSTSSIATGIERSLASRDFARALLDAERLVEVEPRETTYRTLLGRAYLANGRYASARTAFEDALTLGAHDPRTLISLSLVRTAMGSPDSARALLSAHIEELPASDYGLAMAMAGNTQEGIRALMEAVRAPDADAQTRQNLAYALAMDGEWGQARLVAGQDLSGNQLQQRMTQWAANAQPDAYPQRVAGFLGIQPRSDDTGIPARLALSNSEPTSLAAVQPMQATQMAAEAAAQAPIAAATDNGAPVDYASSAADAAFPAQRDAPAPLIHSSADPMRQAVMSRLAEPVTASKGRARQAFASPRNLTLRSQPSASTSGVHGGSDWVVQIGAFNDGKTAAAAWIRAQGKSFEQRGYRKIMGQVTLNGHIYHRLAMSGFNNRDAADQLCGNLRAQGQSCFVRHDAGIADAIRTARAGKSVKTAQTSKPQKIASTGKPLKQGKPAVKPLAIASR
jgi:Flp pilus assembly protein TadD/cell division septation protein DedD